MELSVTHMVRDSSRERATTQKSKIGGGQEKGTVKKLHCKENSLCVMRQIVFPFADQIIVINPCTVVFFAEYNIENIGNICISH